MNLNIFNTDNLYNAATELFAQQGIKLNSDTALPLTAFATLSQRWHPAILVTLFSYLILLLGHFCKDTKIT